uniref:Uncharacterized protein n=1 Tax=Anas zonorhyncha TaxID=75864 RepID=A0A8B9ZUV6_9AVES
MAHYKAADSKREQFRRYLEKSGVLDTLTKGTGRGGSCFSVESQFIFYTRIVKDWLGDQEAPSG